MVLLRSLKIMLLPIINIVLRILKTFTFNQMLRGILEQVVPSIITLWYKNVTMATATIPQQLTNT
jgi:lysophospholipid acyltransferase (LPLAT)-like uncharacterized protein